MNASQQAEESVEIKELARGVYVALAEDGMSNAGLVLGNDQVLVVDTMMLPSQSRDLAAAADRLAPGATKVVVNTHFHGDHTFGNMHFPGAVIVAHPVVRQRLLEAGQSLIERSMRSRPAHAEEFHQVRLTLPNLSCPDRLTLHLADRTVEFFHLGPAHTDGDAVVYLPDDQLLFAGDLLFSHLVPAVQPESNTLGWIEAVTALEAIGLRTVIPGHGPLSTAADLHALRQYLEHVREQVGGCLKRGLTKDETVLTVSLGPAEGWGATVRHASAIARVYEKLSAGA